MNIMDSHHVVLVIPPVADFMADTKYSDVICLKNWREITFIIQKGAGAVGTTTLIVNACDDASPSHRTAMGFECRACLSGDTFTAWEAVSAGGYTTTAGANQVYEVRITGQQVNDAQNGYEWVELEMIESDDDPCLGGVLAVLSNPRYAGGIPSTAIA